MEVRRETAEGSSLLMVYVVTGWRKNPWSGCAPKIITKVLEPRKVITNGRGRFETDSRFSFEQFRYESRQQNWNGINLVGDH
jgi:hypothetical protein